MKLSIPIKLLLISMFTAVIAVGCLLPPGPVSLEIEDVGECIQPEREVAAMHTRTDIEWPTAKCRAQASQLLSKMSLTEKIGQMVQPDRAQLRNDYDLGTHHIGSVLNGGSSDPKTGNDLLSWTKMVAVGHQYSLDSKHKIPALYAVDAVHGHNNVLNTVIFPHNIGLGCTRNPQLVEQVGKVAAEEIAATGIDWTFAPVLAAARDERWGRTYEAFGETPELAAQLGAAMIRGLQGKRLGDSETSVLACAKHYLGDGGTTKGIDRGNTVGSMASIERIHAIQYKAAVEAGVGSIMASYSRVNTVKMHCHGSLLTDKLKGEYGFNGFVVSDWEAVEKLPGRFKEQIRSAVVGGIDMIMAPQSYTGVINTIEDLVPDEIPFARIDDAVGRILSIKCELGMFKPSHYPTDNNGNFIFNEALLKQVGSKAHRDVARQAVRESLVLLKNKNNLLPLKKNLKKIIVAGRNADDLGRQCGGWTISWQGSDGAITRGTTILKAIKNAVSPTGQGTKVILNESGNGAKGADVGIVVIGEGPYAESNGDKKDLSLETEDIDVIKTLKTAGIPVVVILISGRPMILGDALNDADAFVAAWLPGTEGQGVADVLFGDFAPKGKLGHSWPRSMDQIPINQGDTPYDPLFPYGFGLTYGEDTPTRKPPVAHGSDGEDDTENRQSDTEVVVVHPLPKADSSATDTARPLPQTDTDTEIDSTTLTTPHSNDTESNSEIDRSL